MIEARSIPSVSIKDTFASFSYPNYRLWFFGQLISLIGTWMQSAAQGYLIFELTRSPEYLGYVSFAAGLPSWFFTLFAGAIADRMSRRTLMIITQSGMLILAFILAALTFSGVVQWWHILILAFLLGICNAFDAPARQAFVAELVDRHSLTNAIALNSTMFTSAIVVGPAVGGLAYAWVGPGWCFTLNGISFIAVIVALLLMKFKPTTPNPAHNPATRKAIWKETIEGLKYVAHSPTLRLLISNLGVTTVFGLGIATLIPSWAVEILHGDSTTNGFLLSVRGIGSLAGALMIATLGRFKMRGRLWTYGSFAMPVFILIFSFLRWLPLSLLAMLGIGWGFVLINNVSNALVQTHIPDELRGRVMGIYTLVFFGSMPVGSLIAGNMAGWLGQPTTLIINASILLVFATLTLWRVPQLRAME